MIKQLNKLIDNRIKVKTPNVQLKKLIKKRNNLINAIRITDISK